MRRFVMHFYPSYGELPVEDQINQYAMTNSLKIITISAMTGNGIYVLFEECKPKEMKSCLNCDNQYSNDCQICITSKNRNSPVLQFTFALEIKRKRGNEMNNKKDRYNYYRGEKGKKYGIYNTAAKCFQFGICEDTPMLAQARLFQMIGDDARKWRFEPKALSPDGLTAKQVIIDEIGSVQAPTPTANVVEVRHGEWEDVVALDVSYNKYQHTCGACGKSYFDNNKFNYPYCPNCGAKMDGERREE